MREIHDDDPAIRSALLYLNCKRSILEFASHEERAMETKSGTITIPTELKPGPDCDTELVDEFVTESTEHIELMEGSLLAIEETPEDEETLNAVFRGFHTIKGVSGFLGVDAITEMAHIAETLLDRARKGEIRLIEEPLDAVFAAVDLLKVMVTDVSDLLEVGTKPLPDEYEPAYRLLHRLINDDVEEGTEEAPAQSEEAPSAEVVAEAPPENPVEAQPPAEDNLETAEVADQPQSSPVEVAPIAPVGAPAEKAAAAPPKKKQLEGTVRMNMGKLDNLINMVGELVTAQSMVAQDPTLLTISEQRLTKNMSHLSKITRDLQELATSMRMVPLKSTFQKMVRLGRDVAHKAGKKAGKKVSITVTGEDTELDRNLVEELSAPLVHLVRNAVDHGIEPEEVRIAAGKNPVGKVELRAYHSSGNVAIELVDDGKGLDRNRIVNKAIERGLIENGDNMADREVFALCFQAGFSTAEKVTDVSGRGVGLDVVKKMIESMRGQIEVESQVGVGTTITLKLPLTLAIIDGMVVTVGSEKYIIPTIAIESCLKATPDMISTVQNSGSLLMVRGSLLPLFSLSNILSINAEAKDYCSGVVIVVENEMKRCALVADKLLGQQQVVIKGLGDTLQGLPELAGASILGDGRVGLILDIQNVIKRASTRAGVSAGLPEGELEHDAADDIAQEVFAEA